jgi:hypothetical protein
MAVVLHHSRAGGTDKLVLLGIANHDGDGGAWPSVATLARYANVEPRSIKRSIKKLAELGEIEIDRQNGGTRNMPDYTRPNLYHVKVTCPAECDRSAQHRINRSQFDRVTPVSPGDASVTPPGDASVTPPVTPVSPKPSLNHPTNSDKSSSTSTSPGDNGKLPCWNCGRHVIANTSKPKRYCTECSSRGMNSPLIPCTGCGSVRKRAYPGEQDFDCGCQQPTVEQTVAAQWENITPEQVETLKNNHHEIDRTNR